MNYYEITLWVTLEQETAIYELFKHRRWVYSRSDSHASFLYQKERSINDNACLPQIDYLAEEAGNGYQSNVGINFASAHVETFCRDGQDNRKDTFLEKTTLSELRDEPRQATGQEGHLYIGTQEYHCDQLLEKTTFSGPGDESRQATGQGDEQQTINDTFVGKSTLPESGDESHVTSQAQTFYRDGQHNRIDRNAEKTALSGSGDVSVRTADFLDTLEQESVNVESSNAYELNLNTSEQVNVNEQFNNKATSCINSEKHKLSQLNSFSLEYFENTTPATSQKNFSYDIQQHVSDKEFVAAICRDPNNVGENELNIRDVIIKEKSHTVKPLPDSVMPISVVSNPLNIQNDSKSKENEKGSKPHQQIIEEPITSDKEVDRLQLDRLQQSDKPLCTSKIETNQDMQSLSNFVSGDSKRLLRSKQLKLKERLETYRKNKIKFEDTTSSVNTEKAGKSRRKSTDTTEVAKAFERLNKKGGQQIKKDKDKKNTRKSKQNTISKGDQSVISKTKKKKIKVKTSKDEYQSKTDRYKKVSIYCHDCEHTFKYQKNYDKHLEEGKCRHVCEYCGKVFLCGLTGNYKIHLKYHLKLKDHECNICGKKYVEYRKLKEHYRKHSGEKPYMCDECGQTFPGFGSLYLHKKNKHVGIRETFSCSECPKVFKGYSGLAFHMKYYHGAQSEKPYSCAKCEKTFKTPDILKRHESVHRETKDFKCDQCDAAFKRIQGLTEHKKRHTKEYTYFCSHCGKGFYTRPSTLVHERVHTGEKPYTCSLCSYTCSLNGNLKKHLKTHEKHF